VLEYNRANREVAILCNHQRTVPKAFEKAWDKLTAKETLLLRQVEELEEMGAKVKKGAKVAIRSDYDAALAAAGGASSSSSSAASPAKKEKPAAAGAGKPADAEEDGVGAEETPEARVKKLKEEEAHLFAKQPTADEVAKRLTAFRDKLEKHRLDMRNKDENKAVALGTSKINYMDPRITVAWCKRVRGRGRAAAVLAVQRGRWKHVAGASAREPASSTTQPSFAFCSSSPPRLCARRWSCPLRRCSRARCATSSPGRWACPQSSSSEAHPASTPRHIAGLSPGGRTTAVLSSPTAPPRGWYQPVSEASFAQPWRALQHQG
jgi:hypothetical protein